MTPASAACDIYSFMGVTLIPHAITDPWRLFRALCVSPDAAIYHNVASRVVLTRVDDLP